MVRGLLAELELVVVLEVREQRFVIVFGVCCRGKEGETPADDMTERKTKAEKTIRNES